MARPLRLTPQERYYEMMQEPVQTATAEGNDSWGEFTVSLYGVPGSERRFGTLHEAVAYAMQREREMDVPLTATIRHCGRTVFDEKAYLAAAWLEAEAPEERARLTTPRDVAERKVALALECMKAGEWPVEWCVAGDRRPAIPAQRGLLWDRLRALEAAWPRSSSSSAAAGGAEQVFTVLVLLPAVYGGGTVVLEEYMVLSREEVEFVPPSWVTTGTHGRGVPDAGSLSLTVPHVKVLAGLSFRRPAAEGGDVVVETAD